MKICVCTITCRLQPRLDDMAKTLSAAARRAGEDFDLTWIIVTDHSVEMADNLGTIRRQVDELSDKYRIDARVISSPHLQEMNVRVPKHNTTRNIGLHAAAELGADYFLLLDDCTVVTRAWGELVRDCANAGVGVRPKTWYLVDVVIPPNGELAYRDRHDTLHEIPAQTAIGSCWGAPMSAFAKINGFDQAYDGEEKFHDTDAAVRLGRTGLRFVASERAFVINLKRTKNKSEVTGSRKAINGVNNQKLFNALQRDRTRVLPSSSVAPAAAPTGPALPPKAAPRPTSRVRDPQEVMADNLKRFIELKQMVAEGGLTAEDMKVIESELEHLWKVLGPNEKKVADRKVGRHMTLETVTGGVEKTPIKPSGKVVPFQNGSMPAPPMPAGASEFDPGDLDKPVS